MHTPFNFFRGSIRVSVRTALIVFAWAVATAASADTTADGSAQQALLSNHLAVGDVVFIRVNAKPFREVASATNSWTNHVGVVIATNGTEPEIAESTFPFSRATTLSKFVARSEHGRYAVARLKAELTPEQQVRIATAAQKRFGIFYDTGFDLHSKRQFCSRFVREVLAEATDVQVGEVETFANLLARNPNTNLHFWKIWYFGHIPWQRETVTPASLLTSPNLQLVYEHPVSSGLDAEPGPSSSPQAILE